VASTGTQSSGGVFPRISKTNRDGMAAIRLPYFARSETEAYTTTCRIREEGT
jgi:hypothetical protein